MGNDDWISVEEAAKALNLKRRRVRDMINAGILVARRMGERVWMVSASSVAEEQARRLRAGGLKRRTARPPGETDIRVADDSEDSHHDPTKHEKPTP